MREQAAKQSASEENKAKTGDDEPKKEETEK